jgi:hypothetical protein
MDHEAGAVRGSCGRREADAGTAKHAAAPVYIFFTAASPPPAGARGEHQSPLFLWRPDFEPRTRSSLVSSLLACCPLPAPATAQTRRRLRAGH